MAGRLLVVDGNQHRDPLLASETSESSPPIRSSISYSSQSLRDTAEDETKVDKTKGSG